MLIYIWISLGLCFVDTIENIFSNLKTSGSWGESVKLYFMLLYFSLFLMVTAEVDWKQFYWYTFLKSSGHLSWSLICCWVLLRPLSECLVSHPWLFSQVYLPIFLLMCIPGDGMSPSLVLDSLSSPGKSELRL